MEKRRPTFDLDAFKAASRDPKELSITVTALRNAAEIGFDRAAVAATIQSMERAHFYKSMTSYADHRIWHDVYHVPRDDLTIYLKFTADVLTEFVVLSFKEK